MKKLSPKKRIEYLNQYKELLDFYSNAIRLTTCRILMRYEKREIPDIDFEIDTNILKHLGFNLSELININSNTNKEFKNKNYFNNFTEFYGYTKKNKSLNIKIGDKIPEGYQIEGVNFRTDFLMLLQGRIEGAFNNILVHIGPFLIRKEVPELRIRKPLFRPIPEYEDYLESLAFLDKQEHLYRNNLKVAIQEANHELIYNDDEIKEHLAIGFNSISHHQTKAPTKTQNTSPNCLTPEQRNKPVVDLQKLIIIYKGEEFAVEYRVALIFNKLIKANGVFLKWKEFKSDPANDERPDRIIKTGLPKPLLLLLETKKGLHGGVRLKI